MPRRWIPNILTVINLCAGLVALGLAFVQQWALAIALIFGAALFESIDGRIARRLNATNEYTRKFDAFADWISFGIVPAILAFLLCYSPSEWSSYILVAVFPVCGALRLARFNPSHVKGYYVGLPITIAGPALAACAYLAQRLPIEAHAIILLVLSGLMISAIRVPKM